MHAGNPNLIASMVPNNAGTAQSRPQGAVAVVQNPAEPVNMQVAAQSLAQATHHLSEGQNPQNKVDEMIETNRRIEQLIAPSQPSATQAAANQPAL